MEILQRVITKSNMSRSGILIGNVENIVVRKSIYVEASHNSLREYFEYLKNQTTTYASTHYIVGLDGEIIQCIPGNEVAWHSANYELNRKSIGIELCISKNGIGDNTKKNLKKLVNYLSKKHNLTQDNIIYLH